MVCSECKYFYDTKKLLRYCPVCKKNFVYKNICLNLIYEEYHFFTKIKKDKNKKGIINLLTEKKDKNKNQYFLDLNDTLLRDQKYNNLSLSNNNIKSYIKKKPEDFYNYTNRNRDGEENGLSRSKNKKGKRNLSIVFQNKNFYKNNDLLIKKGLNSTGKKENYNHKFSLTNNDFYKKKINSSKKDIKSKNNISFIIDSINNDYLKTQKNQDKKFFSKINFISSISPRIKNIIRFASKSSRNYNGEEKEEKKLISDFNWLNKIRENNFNNLSNLNLINYQIYVPKKKLDLNKSSLNISLNNNNNFENNFRNNEEIELIKKK